MRLVIVLALAVSLASCVPITAWTLTDCDGLTGSALHSQMGTEIDIQQFIAWIMETYEVPNEAVKMESWKDTVIVEWDTDRIRYSVVISEALLDEVALYYKTLTPQVGQIVECLGAPAYYKATYQLGANPGNQLSASFLYPSDGILISGSRFLRLRPEVPPAITGEFRVLALGHVRPGSKEDVLSRIYGGSPGLYEEMLTQYKPWPGSWDEITIDIDTSLLREP